MSVTIWWNDEERSFITFSDISDYSFSNENGNYLWMVDENGKEIYVNMDFVKYVEVEE